MYYTSAQNVNGRRWVTEKHYSLKVNKTLRVACNKNTVKLFLVKTQHICLLWTFYPQSGYYATCQELPISLSILVFDTAATICWIALLKLCYWYILNGPSVSREIMTEKKMSIAGTSFRNTLVFFNKSYHICLEQLRRWLRAHGTFSLQIAFQITAKPD